MKKRIYALLIMILLLAGGSGWLIWGTGCDEVKAPCDATDTKTGTFLLFNENLESWQIENGYCILRFMFPEKTIFFVCTDRTVNYQLTLYKKYDTTMYLVAPQARLVWKYAAPAQSKSVLMGHSELKILKFENSRKYELNEDKVSLAYSESEVGGYFIPGVEIKIPTLGNRSDDYNFVKAKFDIISDYEITYHISF